MTRMPQVTARDLVRFLKAQGFIEDHQTGSHLTLWHPGRNVSVTVPMHSGCDVGRGLALRILKDAGFSVDDFLRLR
jgi:predicted RNA binding protein YcfA (HicA-like mRNA interferase family)